MGTEINGFNSPVCDSFEAKIRNDQLCYEIDLEKYKDTNKIKEHLKSGLVLLLDYNLERQSEMYDPKKVIKSGSEENEKDVQIYLETISKLHFKKINN